MKKEKEMKKSYLPLAIIGLIILVAVLTNPSEEKHKEIIQKEWISYMHDFIYTDDEDELRQAFRAMFAEAAANYIITNVASTTNYVLLSTTEVVLNGEHKFVGIGFFGNVFIFGLDQDLVENTSTKLRQEIMGI